MKKKKGRTTDIIGALKAQAAGKDEAVCVIDSFFKRYYID